MDYFSLARQFVVHSFEKSGDVQPLRHFDRTVYWVEQLMPNADEAMRVAAFAHDIERLFVIVPKNPSIPRKVSTIFILCNILQRRGNHRKIFDRAQPRKPYRSRQNAH